MKPKQDNEKNCYKHMFSSKLLPFLFGWITDRLLGDPEGWPHPIVFFGELIQYGEKRLNHGTDRLWKGGLLTVVLVGGTFYFVQEILRLFGEVNYHLIPLFTAIGVFYCLAGKTLITEVQKVFEAVDKSVEEGRTQLARIVGRDTSQLSSQQIRTAALETLAENLSDGVIAPMFWFLLLGLPGMMAYKMVNTLDSMIGYKNERYLEFGKVAAKLDDLANYIPARLTAILMLLVSHNWNKLKFVIEHGKKHASPNAGYPEAALAAILNGRFGGPNFYFGKLVEKPYIGDTPKDFTTQDLLLAIQINNYTELVMGIIVCVLLYIWN